MNVSGKRILIFGDSLSHDGSDSDPEQTMVTGPSTRSSSAVGSLLGSLLLEAGASAVMVDSNVGRSAANFWAGTASHQFQSAATLIASDQVFAPDIVIVILGTNDIGTNLVNDQVAMQAIHDSFPSSEVWAIGPFTYVPPSNLNDGAQAVFDMMVAVFGADKTIDARPLTATIGRAGDGVHFQPASAYQTALALMGALAEAPGVATWKTVAWGVAGVVALLAAGAVAAKYMSNRKQLKGLNAPGDKIYWYTEPVYYKPGESGHMSSANVVKGYIPVIVNNGKVSRGSAVHKYTEKEARAKAQKFANEAVEDGEIVIAGRPPGSLRGAKEPGAMTPAQINKELDKLDIRDSELTDEMISSGRGHERPSDYHRKTDPLSVAINDNSNARHRLYNEISSRMGYGSSSGAPHRFPDGWRTPRKKKGFGAADDDEDEGEDIGSETWFEKIQRQNAERTTKIAKAFETSPAIVLTARDGRETLLIKSGETANPEEGAFRVSSFGHDGPIGHMTRSSEDKLIDEVARDYYPIDVRPVSDDEIIAWTSTPEFEEGSRRVAEVQRINMASWRASKLED